MVKVNNNKFTRSYVETVASQWCRMNIETVEEAMEVAEKEHKKIKKLTEKKTPSTKNNNIKEELPSWFEKNIEKKEMSKEEKEELNNLLKEF